LRSEVFIDEIVELSACECRLRKARHSRGSGAGGVAGPFVVYKQQSSRATERNGTKEKLKLQHAIADQPRRLRFFPGSGVQI
jgi:hypothetical protein